MGSQTSVLMRETMLYCDVDGTLIGRTGALSSKVRHAVERFIGAGCGFSLATGRSLQGVKRLLSQLPINTPLVLSNGAYVYDPVTGRARWSSLSHSVVNEVLPLLLAVPGARIYIERSDCTLWTPHAAVLRERYALVEDLNPHVFRSVDEVLADGDVIKLGIKLRGRSQASRPVATLMDRLKHEFAEDVAWCFSSEDYLEVMPGGTSKWSGILVSQSMRGCRDKTIVTVGDHQNDVQMIANADLGIAMGNAVQSVKGVASECIGSVEEDAVVELLDSLRRRQSTGCVS